MKMLHRAAGVTGVVVAGLLTSSPTANAATGGGKDVTCTGTVSSTTVHNVTVPARSSCTLDRVRVTGRVTSQSLSSIAITRSVVQGDVVHGGSLKDDGSELQREKVTVDRSVVAGNIVVSLYGDLTVTRSTVRSVTGEDPISYGARFTFSDVVVVRDVYVVRGAYNVITLTRVVVGGKFTGNGWNTSLDRSVVRGEATVSGEGGAGVCGSRLAGLNVYASYVLVVGDGGKCAGNVIHGHLNVNEPMYNAVVYNNTVYGKATSPSGPPQQDPDGNRGSGNRFLGGVTGYLAKLT